MKRRITNLIKAIINHSKTERYEVGYNSWHSGQRYVHHGTQAKYNQRQGLARANKLPNTTALKVTTVSISTTAITPYAFTRWRHQSGHPITLPLYRPRKDARLSWPSWLTCSGRFSHIINGNPSTTGRAQKVRPPMTDVLPLCHATNQQKQS